MSVQGLEGELGEEGEPGPQYIYQFPKPDINIIKGTKGDKGPNGLPGEPGELGDLGYTGNRVIIVLEFSKIFFHKNLNLW